jgi:hypothetical protein
METIVIRRWILQTDPEATRVAFSDVPTGSPESCGCGDCLNFVAARDRAYPPEALAIFEQLGIDRSKESEIWHNYRDASGQHHYGGFFHFVGALEGGKDAMVMINGHGTYDLERIAEEFDFGLTSNVALVPAAFGENQIVQLEFQTRIPWVLNTPESE